MDNNLPGVIGKAGDYLYRAEEQLLMQSTMDDVEDVVDHSETVQDDLHAQVSHARKLHEKNEVIIYNKKLFTKHF